MKFGTITRGDRKIYILLTASCPEGATLVAESVAHGGNAVPALICEKDTSKGEYVLILPLLYVDQTVRVRVIDAGGGVVDEASQRVGHLTSAFAAKYNTFSKAVGVNDIRNYDRLARHDVSHIEPRHVCHMGYESDKTELVNIIVTAYCKDENARKASYSVTVFDRRGSELLVTNCETLSDKIERPVPHSDFEQRAIHLSFRKPYGVDWFFIWVRFENDALAPALLCMDKWRTEYYRNRFEENFNKTGQDACYEDWFYYTQKKAPMQLDAQRSVRFEIEPVFSIIVPLYKTPLGFFDEMARSVLDQTYGKLELILVNSTPEDGELSAAVSSLAQSDDRVRVITLDKNYGIAGNTNEGIRAATGDFLCFFDHDDVLELGLLFEYVDALNRYPETDLFYCDEDKMTDGHLYDGFLKSDFSWELLTTCNYVCHLLTVRKSIVDEVELSPDELSGVQDWDMTMKVAERARNVFHVRKVLYHWRAHKQSTASGAGAKSYTHEAGELALMNHFERIGVPVRVHDGIAENIHRIEYILPEKEALVSIIIPNKDHAALLEHCLDSIWEKTTYRAYEVLIIENNSVESETFALYDRLQAEHDNLRVIHYEGPFNYSAINNMGVKHANGEYILFLNNDMEIITPGWIEGLLGPLQRNEVAAVGAQLLYPDDTIQHTGVVIPRSGPYHVARLTAKTMRHYFNMTNCARDMLAVTGACLMVSREDFDSIGGFDEELAVNYNDVDFCLRLGEKGKRVVIDPYVELYHFESVSRGPYETSENRRRLAHELALFQERWSEYFACGDPYYGTNIAISEHYALDWNVRA